MSNGSPHTELRPEMRLLLACARRSMDAARIETAAALMRAAIDWQRLQALCVRHAVLPLVARQLDAHFAALVPAEAHASFGRAARAALGQSLMLAEELRRVLAALAARDVRALAYKGPALALQIHGDVTLRSFRDLDLLVTRGDFFRAREVLLALGYRAAQVMTGAQEEALLRSECDQTLIHDASGAIVELHWAVTPPHLSFPLATEALLERAVTVDLQGLPVQAPSREDLVLLLAVNGAKDLWLSLEPACLIAALLSGPPLEWEVILERADRLRAHRWVALGVTLAAQLMDVALPPALARLPLDPTLVSLAHQASQRLLDDRRPVPTLLEIARFRTESRERWADRLRYFVLWAVTPTREDCAVVPLPRRWWPAAYAIRPLRLLARSIAGRNPAR